MTRDERACHEAMINAPWMTEALLIDYAAEVMIARGMDRPAAESMARRVYDKHLRTYGGAG